jgi:hypothetical protein
MCLAVMCLIANSHVGANELSSNDMSVHRRLADDDGKTIHPTKKPTHAPTKSSHTPKPSYAPTEPTDDDAVVRAQYKPFY